MQHTGISKEDERQRQQQQQQQQQRQQQQEEEYQDPLLNPGQLKQIVKNLPGKQKHPHDDYHYGDSDDLLTEIDEFFNYTEVAMELNQYPKTYSTDFGTEWKFKSNQENRKQIEYILDQLEHAASERRIRAAKHLVYISLGGYDSAERSLAANIIEHNQFLYDSGALPTIFQAFKFACSRHDSQNTLAMSPGESSDLNCEIELYITLMYIMIESLRASGHFTDERGFLDPSIMQHLFLVVSQLRDKHIKSFPVKKLVLLLWKAMLCTFGGLKELKVAKTAARALYGLKPINDDIISKCTPQDIHAFQNEITLKYPTYTPPDIPLPISTTMSIKATPSLAVAMGIADATTRTDLPYQTLFPPKSSANSSSNNTRKPQQSQLQQLNLTWTAPQSQSFILPLSINGPGIPRSTIEAGDLYVRNMHLSLANHQIILEREKAIHKWERKKEDSSRQGTQETLGEVSDPKVAMSAGIAQRFDAIEQIYAAIIPELQNIVIVLLKFLLSTVTAAKINGKSSKHTSNNNNITTEKEQQELEDADALRNREILSKAISAILFLSLKWTKISHILKSEYISQLLVDSGCLLLILKILGLQEVTALVAAKTDLEGSSFSDKYDLHKKPVTSNRPYTNARNMFWTINFLRILQMLTKRKTHRIMLLVQYKSSAILKRILKVSHPVMELYTLKILKSQVPYLGRKWRSLNMKIVSAIYLRCHTVLKDDWISKYDTDSDMEDGMMQEINLRLLIRLYNGQRYLPAMLPQQDEPSGLDKGAAVTSAFEEDIELDPAFLANYEEWLEENVYHSERTDDEDSYSATENALVDRPLPGTPVPSSPMMEALTDGINTLYHKELEQEFSAQDDIDDMARLDPVKYIADRLFQVEQNTIKRWSDPDMRQWETVDEVGNLRGV
ncbi:hypothetical protein BX666DRAFT_1910199 [Dichotomocladium elegans]|nr:hypothetical protein BX666DRAFT_1910199 [Dichotomocladium elegans]